MCKDISMTNVGVFGVSNDGGLVSAAGATFTFGIRGIDKESFRRLLKDCHGIRPQGFHACIEASTHDHAQRAYSVGGALYGLGTDRAMEAWYHLHCMNDPQAGGSHGKLHRTTKILSHAARQRGRVAARGACAAALDASDRVPQQRIA